MNKWVSTAIFFLLFSLDGKSQILQLIDRLDRKDITDDSVWIQSGDNGGWVGAESLDLSVLVKNTSSTSKEIKAKKIEYELLPSSVEHTICFAGQCYKPTTFVSDFSVMMPSGSSDSGFLAHYLFENTTHKRGINHVKYVFYDVNNMSDSAFVFVTYNTVVSKSSLYHKPNETNFKIVQLSENCIQIEGLNNPTHQLAIYDMMGCKKEATQIFNSTQCIMDVSKCNRGLYIISIDGAIKKWVKE